MYLAQLKAIESLDTPWPSLASRTHLQSRTRRSLPIRTRGPIHRMPPEILSKVFVDFALANVNPMVHGIPTSTTYIPMVLCHVSCHWRQIALSTPQLWENLSIRLVLYGVTSQAYPGTVLSGRLVVRKQTIDFLYWWAANIRANNRFALRIQFIWREYSDIYQNPHPRMSDMVVLGKYGLAIILNLVSRARFLHMDNYTHNCSFVHSSDMPHPITELLHSDLGFPSTESLVFQHSDNPENFYRLPFHLMPALRKLRLDTMSPRLWQSGPFVLDSARATHPYLQPSLNTMWRRLTHLSLRILRATIAEWKAFMGTCVALESARINLMLEYSPHGSLSRPRGGSGIRTLPNLRELALDVFDRQEVHSDVNLFQDLHFPRLQSLILHHTRVLPRAVLHLLLQSTPSLERLHIGSAFPFALDNRRELAREWVDPLRHVGRLNDHVPYLKQLVFTIPHEGDYRDPLVRYANGILRNGWLQGPWNDDATPLRVEFVWFPRKDSREEEIWQLEEFFDSQMELDAFREDVELEVKGISVSPFELDIVEFDAVPLWEAWFNFDGSFCRGEEASLRYLGTPDRRPLFHSLPPAKI